jgi:hypothetical protein
MRHSGEVVMGTIPSTEARQSFHTVEDNLRLAIDTIPAERPGSHAALITPAAV